MKYLIRHGLVAILLLGACSCTGPGRYVWVHDLPAESFSRGADNEYVIHDGDLLSIQVFNQEPLSTKARVRSDGRLAMPVIGDIEVRGKRPSVLKGEIEARLSEIVVKPSVTVIVEEFQPITVSSLGEVGKPGSFAVDPRATVAQVLALAGGLTEYASHDRIFVVRGGRRAMRVRFTYDEISRGEPRSMAFSLQQGDLVVVE